VVPEIIMRKICLLFFLFSACGQASNKGKDISDTGEISVSDTTIEAFPEIPEILLEYSGDALPETVSEIITESFDTIPETACGIDGKPCDDGNACTMDDICTEGLCKGTIYSCNDGIKCTEDICLGDGKCDHVIKDGFCLIAKACYSSGFKNPANLCVICDPSKSTGQWSAKGGVCDDNNPCTVSDHCSEGICTGIQVMCTDDNNPCTEDVCNPLTGLCGVPVPDCS
jgi:hypothetical protein